MIFKGLAIGFVGAATLGPIGFLIIQRTISKGKSIGLASGIGVALADAIYGLIGVLGITLITEFMVGNQMILRVIGGITLIWLGVKSMVSIREAHKPQAESTSKSSLFSAMSTILLLTLSNPMTILYFTAVYAGILSEFNVNSIGSSLQFVTGVFVGSIAWWILLVMVSEWLKEKMTPNNLSWLNKISGFLIAGFGVWIILSVFI